MKDYYIEHAKGGDPGAPLFPVEAAYDWMAYYSGNPVQKWWKRRIAKHVWNFLPPKTTKRLLDVGCGTSPIIRAYRGAVGIDRDPGKIEWMRFSQPDIHNTYLVHDIEKHPLPFDDGAFNGVICIEVLEHLADPFEAIKEMARVVNVGDFVILATPDYSRWQWRLTERLYKRFKPGDYCDDHVTPLSLGLLNAQCSRYNLWIDDYRYVGGGDLVARFRKLG